MTVSLTFPLTKTQLDAIEELRKRLYMDFDEKKCSDTFMIYRFLRARNFNVEQAETMIRKDLEWRKQMQLDQIGSYEPPEPMIQYFTNSRFAVDKEGSACHYVAFGKYDAKGLVMSTKFSDIEKSVLQQIERDEKFYETERKKVGDKMPGFTYIYDMDGLTFANATNKKGLEYIVRLIRMFQDHYPERLKALYIINAQSYFTISFSICKVVIDNNIFKKIHLFGTDGYQEKLAEIIEAEQLPAFLGGKMQDPDGNPKCLTRLCYAGVIPEKFYMQKTKRDFLNLNGVKKLNLSRASFSEINIDVEKAGSVIEWEFETKSRDIGFGLFLKEKDGDEEKVTALVPLLRLDADNFAETGIYKCEKAGKYTMLFDNSYSWVRSKEIYYKYTVVSPKEHEELIFK